MMEDWMNGRLNELNIGMMDIKIKNPAIFVTGIFICHFAF